jgi:hypothetical protein
MSVHRQRLKLLGRLLVAVLLSRCAIYSAGLQYGLDNSIYDEYDSEDNAEKEAGKSNGGGYLGRNNEQFNPKSGSVNSAETSYNLVGNKSHLLSSFVNKCRSDQSCNADSICNAQTGTCVKLCDIRHKYSKSAADCVYFHCDGKQLFVADEPKSTSEFVIETNNYPYLNRYLSRRRCAWILKSSSSNSRNATSDGGAKDSETLIQKTNIPLVQLEIKRFATEFANDYLYIFAGDSIYSPLVATLR